MAYGTKSYRPICIYWLDSQKGQEKAKIRTLRLEIGDMHHPQTGKRLSKPKAE